MRDFMLAFIPLFAAVKPVGTIPMFLNLTKNLGENPGFRHISQETNNMKRGHSYCGQNGDIPIVR